MAGGSGDDSTPADEPAASVAPPPADGHREEAPPAAARSNAADRTRRSAGGFPAAGRLVWVPPGGDPREIEPVAVRLARQPGVDDRPGADDRRPPETNGRDATVRTTRSGEAVGPTRADSGPNPRSVDTGDGRSVHRENGDGRSAHRTNGDGAVSDGPGETGSRSGDRPAERTVRTCPDCTCARSVPTIVREHAACGHVGLDGFVASDGRDALVCPKCGAAEGTDAATGNRTGTATEEGEAGAEENQHGGPDGNSNGSSDGGSESGAAFPVVGRVHSCLECGRVLDRPLGPTEGPR